MRQSAWRAQGYALLACTIFLVTLLTLPPFGANAVAQNGAGPASPAYQLGRTSSSPLTDPNSDGVGSSDVRAGHILVRFKASPSQDVLNRLGVEFAANVV